MKEDESDCKSKVGVRGKLDLMSNVFTITRTILWTESAKEIHQNIFQNFCITMDLLFYTSTILSHLFPYLDYDYYFRYFEMQTLKAIPIGYCCNAPRVALELDYPLLNFSSGYQE